MHRLNTCMQRGGALCQNVRQAFQGTTSLHDCNNHIHHTQFQHRYTQYRTSFIKQIEMFKQRVVLNFFNLFKRRFHQQGVHYLGRLYSL
jgi:hypothetical protein